MEIKNLKISYHTAPVNKNVHKIKPIGELFNSYITEAKRVRGIAGCVIVDPFARNSTLTKWSNDINPNTDATFHMDAADFLQFLYDQGLRANVVIFDPPFSTKQNRKSYKIKSDAQSLKKTIDRCKQILPRFMNNGGIVISTGWTANGVGKWRGFEKKEFVVVNHGSHHYSTQALVEYKAFEPIHVVWDALQKDKIALMCGNDCVKFTRYKIELAFNSDTKELPFYSKEDIISTTY